MWSLPTQLTVLLTPCVALVPIDTEEVSEAGALIYSSMPQASLEAEAQHAEETAAAIVDRHRKRSAIVDDFRGLYRMPTHFELPPPPAEDAWKRLQEIHPEDAFRKLSLMPTHDLPKIWRVRIVVRRSFPSFLFAI